MFLAVTSSPRGKCRSIFLTGGLVSNFLSTAGSSTVLGDEFNFLVHQISTWSLNGHSGEATDTSTCSMIGADQTYQFSFWVSFAISNSFPSFSIYSSALDYSLLSSWGHSVQGGQLLGYLPSSAMLKTPETLELVLRWPIFFSAVGDDDKPEMAESTLVRSEVVSMASEDMFAWLRRLSFALTVSDGYSTVRLGTVVGRRSGTSTTRRWVNKKESWMRAGLDDLVTTRGIRGRQCGVASKAPCQSSADFMRFT